MENKVMIVDDDEYVRLSVCELMKFYGIPAVGADGALSCLEELEKGFRGVILMDIMMPEYDGWDAIRMIVESGRHSQVIIAMLTAMEQPDRKMEGLQEYVADYITKPFSPKDLVAIVKDKLSFIGDE